MLNEPRFKRTLPVHEREVFQAGVCGNEAFQSEVKAAFNNSKMHPAVVQMKLSYLYIRKMLAHNSTLYHPTLRRMEEYEVLARRVPSIVLWHTDKTWVDWCVLPCLTTRGMIPHQGVQHASEVRRLKIWSQQKGMKGVRKHIVKKRTIFRQKKNKSLLRRQR